MRIAKLIKRIYYKYFLSNEDYLRKIGVKIGKNCSIHTRKFGTEPYLISIGDNVQITDDVAFFTHGGGWVLRNEIPDLDFFGKITVKDNVYIGAGSYILPGVTIESNVIIGARSVVTKSVPTGMIVAGNPARIVGTIDSFRKKAMHYDTKTKQLTIIEKRKVLETLPEDKFIVANYL